MEKAPYEKISPNVRKKVENTLKRLQNELGREFTLREDPDTFIVTDGKREIHFQKSDKLPVRHGEDFIDIEKVVEQKIRKGA